MSKQGKYFSVFLTRLAESKDRITTTATPSELKKYEPKAEGERKFADKHTVKKIADANKNGDDVFTASNIKPIDRPSTRHGYNPGADEAAYEDLDLDALFAEVQSLEEGTENAKHHYRETHAAILSKLDSIKAGLKSHKENSKENTHWGHVSDLTHVHDRLREVHQFLDQSYLNAPAEKIAPR